MRPLLALAAAIALCASVSACGGVRDGSGASATGTAKESAGPATAPRLSRNHVYGDHDEDDGPGGQSVHDGDPDDISGRQDRDGDSDNASGTYYDADDRGVRAFGHAAGTVDRRAVAALVTRYIAAAAVEDGQAACSTMESSIASSVAEDLGGASGPPYARGDTCAAVMSKIFRANHRQFAAYHAQLTVADVQLQGGRGSALLSFGTLPARQIPVIREGGSWKLDAVLDRELP